jgi:hypothetical protein
VSVSTFIFLPYRAARGALLLEGVFIFALTLAARRLAA